MPSTVVHVIYAFMPAPNMCQYSDGTFPRSTFRGRWSCFVSSPLLQLPAGVIEQGETVEQLAVRELKEETGEPSNSAWC